MGSPASICPDRDSTLRFLRFIAALPRLESVGVREQSELPMARGRVWPIAAIIALSMGLATITALRSECLPFDAFGFIRYAREIERAELYTPAPEPWTLSRQAVLDRSPLAALVASRAQHPGHSLLILGAHQVLRKILPGAETTLWAASARGVSILSFGLLVLFSYWLYRTVFGEAAALIGSAIVGLSPAMIRIGSDALSDAPAAACMVLSGLCFCKLSRTHRVRYALAGAAAAGSAYWIRPEAIQLALLALVFLGARFLLGSGSRRQTAMSLVVLVITLGVMTVPYMALRQSPLTKKAHTVELMLGPAADAGNASLSSHPAQFVPPEPRPTFHYHHGLGYFLFRWFVLSAFVFLPVIAVGILVSVRSLLRPDRLLLAAALAANVLGLPLVLYVLTGYLDIRHTVPALVFSAGFAWSGLLAITVAMRETLSWAKRRWTGAAIHWPVSAPVAALAAAALFFAAMAGYAISVRSNAGVSGYRQAGLWLAKQVAMGDAVIDPAYAATFYAKLDEQNPWADHGVFRFARIAALLKKHPQVRWLVISDRLVREREQGQALPRTMGGVRLSEAFSCPISMNPGGFDFVRVYHVDDAIAGRDEPPR